MILTSIRPADLEWIDDAIDRWECSQRWALRGQTPSPSVLERLLWEDVAVQQAVRTNEGQAMALFQLTNVDLYNGVGELGVLADQKYTRHLHREVVHFLERAFRELPLRKIYLGVVNDELGVARHLDHLVRPIGRFPRRLHRGGNVYVDVEILEIAREAIECPPGAEAHRAP